MGTRKKKQKEKNIHTTKRKPYTNKQKNDIVVGKIINWSFILSFPLIAFLTWAMSLDIKVGWFIWGISSLLFSFYNLIGLIFKWDHARVCAKNFLRHTYKFDIITTEMLSFISSLFQLFLISNLYVCLKKFLAHTRA